MAPKKQKTGRGSSRWSDPKFLSKEAKERYEESLEKERGFIQERGMDFGEDDVTGITNAIRKLGWQQFTQTPEDGIAPLIMEFYANVPDSEHGKTRVRGKDVLFDVDTINEYYGLATVDMDEYDEYVQNVDHMRVIRALTAERTEWVMVGNRYKKFPASSLKLDAHIWQYFVNTRLIPTTHNSSVDRMRAILIYSIITTKKMNVGKIIVSQIVHCARNPQNSYSFPNLITGLCRKAGITYTSSSWLIHPGICLSDHYMNKLSKGKRHIRPQGAGASSSSASQRENEDSLHDKLDAIRDYQEQQTVWMYKQCGCIISFKLFLPSKKIEWTTRG